MKKLTKVLFVCMGNICRSPTAHAIFEKQVQEKKLTDQIEVESAGTHSRVYHHEGALPDSRSMKAAKEKGIDMSYIRSRQFLSEDFYEYDYIIVMDDANMHSVQSMLPEVSLMHKIHKLTEYADDKNYTEISDPYYSGGFMPIFELIENCCSNLLNVIIKSQ
jgi:protein-tyrosine phosphatase